MHSAISRLYKFLDCTEHIHTKTQQNTHWQKHLPPTASPYRKVQLADSISERAQNKGSKFLQTCFKPTIQCLFGIKSLDLVLSIFLFFLQAGHMQSTQLAGPNIALCFPRLLVHIYGLCICTYQVHSVYVTYIVAKQLYIRLHKFKSVSSFLCTCIFCSPRVFPICREYQATLI